MGPAAQAAQRFPCVSSHFSSPACAAPCNQWRHSFEASRIVGACSPGPGHSLVTPFEPAATHVLVGSTGPQVLASR
eukprot:364782-Chlamydomonas_euryale.AAC.20